MNVVDVFWEASGEENPLFTTGGEQTTADPMERARALLELFKCLISILKINYNLGYAPKEIKKNLLISVSHIAINEL